MTSENRGENSTTVGVQHRSTRLSEINIGTGNEVSKVNWPKTRTLKTKRLESEMGAMLYAAIHWKGTFEFNAMKNKLQCSIPKSTFYKRLSECAVAHGHKNFKALQVDRGAFNFAEHFSLVHLGGGDWSKFKTEWRTAFLSGDQEMAMAILVTFTSVTTEEVASNDT